MYSQKNRKLHKFAKTNSNIFFSNSTLSEMHHRKTYMYINFQQNRVSSLSDMHDHLTDIQADFEINRPNRYQITSKRNYFHRRQTDRQTDGRTDGQTSRITTVGSFSEKKKYD